MGRDFYLFFSDLMEMSSFSVFKNYDRKLQNNMTF